MSQAMLNIITKDTTKEQMREVYAQYPDTQPKGFEAFHASTVEPMFCEVLAGSKVLDVGCNSGEMMKLLMDGKNCDVTGVDISDLALDLARKKGLTVFNASAEELPFADETFDVVILREVLVHIHEPLKALKEIRRVLKKDGFLLGSAPHANLEKIAWDDKRLHHRYYDETTLINDLKTSFAHTHLRVLNGAQFALSFANSMLSDQPCELLWKSGNKDVPEWEHALKTDTKTLRVWMGPTQPIGCAYYRMIGFAHKMRDLKETEIAFETFSWNQEQGCNEWQRKLLMREGGEPISALALHHFETCLKVANPWVFQVTYYEDILTLFEALKEAFPDKKLITDSDDWIFDIPAYNVASHPYKPNSRVEQIAHEQFKLSDAIIVSTSFLKENLQTMFPDKPIHVIPNSIDFELWEKADSDNALEPKKEGTIRIVYSGCGNHNGDLEIVKPVLLELLNEFPNLEVIMAQEFKCFKDVTNPRFRVLKRWVPIPLLPRMMKGWDADIGIAPLRDNNFNRAKSNLRWLEYSALRLPAVMSKVRPFAESVEHDKTGLLCSSRQEWYDALKKLITDEKYRKRVGHAAYVDVFNRFNMDKTARDYADLLKEIRTDGR